MESCSIMTYPSMAFPEGGVLLEKGGGGIRRFMDAPFGQGLVKAALMSVSLLSSALMLE